MKTRTVQQILPPPPSHMVGDGFRVHNFFPGGYNMKQDRMSPFFLLDYNAKMEFSPRDTPRGVGVHPHRGFETVTFAYHGKVAHHDSRGNKGVIGVGDIQWMTAASGILHKEYHEVEYSKKGGPFQMVQLWINLPAEYKMAEPAYQAIVNHMIPRYEIPGGGGTVEVVAGEYEGIKGIAHTFTPLFIYNIRMNKDARLKISLPPGYNSGILVIEGDVQVNRQEDASVNHFILFNNDGDEFELGTKSGCVLLLLSGEPINEPIVAYGPFVMNSKEEILQAYRDIDSGKFGELKD